MNSEQRKVIYDGKRIQPIYERKMVDYTSSYIYSLCNGSRVIPYSAKASYTRDVDLSSQIISMTFPPTTNHRLFFPYRSYPVKFVQMCINKQRSQVNSIAWSPDGRRLLSGSSSGEITMWNGAFFNFDTILQAHTFPIKKIQFSRNSSASTLLLSGDSRGTLKYWNTSMSNLNIIESLHTEAIKDISFSYNDNIFLTASDDSTIKLVDTNSAQVISTLKGHNWDIRKALFHPQYSLIASGGKDNLLKLWDPRQGVCLKTLHTHKNTILSMDISNDSMITGGKDQVIKQFSFRRMREVFSYKTNSDVTSLTFVDRHGGVTGGSFASGNAHGEIFFWDEMQEFYSDKTMSSHENTVWCLEMHPMGHLLASGSADFQVKFWSRLRPGDNKETILLEDEEMMNNETNKIPGL